jgi:hypothetical protein
MTAVMSGFLDQREYDKFVEVDKKTCVRVFDSIVNSLVPGEYDYIVLSYTGSDLTGVVYKKGGVSGTTVSTLTLGYSGGNLVSVAKT